MADKVEKKPKESFFQIAENWKDDLRMRELKSKWGLKGIGCWLIINDTLNSNGGLVPYNYKLFSGSRDKEMVEDIIENSGYYTIKGTYFSSPDIDEQLAQRQRLSETRRGVIKEWHDKKKKIGIYVTQKIVAPEPYIPTKEFLEQQTTPTPQPKPNKLIDDNELDELFEQFEIKKMTPIQEAKLNTKKTN